MKGKRKQKKGAKYRGEERLRREEKGEVKRGEDSCAATAGLSRIARNRGNYIVA